MIPEAHAWAAEEARELGDDYVGPEHFLLGLSDAGFDLQDLRDEVLAR